MMDHDEQMIPPPLTKPEILKLSTGLWHFPPGSLLLVRGSKIIRCSENCKVGIVDMKQTIISFNLPGNLIFWKYFRVYLLEAVAKACFYVTVVGVELFTAQDPGKWQQDLKTAPVSLSGKAQSPRQQGWVWVGWDSQLALRRYITEENIAEQAVALLRRQLLYLKKERTEVIQKRKTDAVPVWQKARKINGS